MGEGSGHGSGRVRLFVDNRGSGRVGSTFRRVGSKKSDPWTTLVPVVCCVPVPVHAVYRPINGCMLRTDCSGVP